ncbi:MAG TPA: Na+/H+ antiporter subunit A, partial [Candidatus Janibacter merdipullorum]|nr:Na+/H+ antiporter subunit A [Candidatus Janibacter merdipullorum]
MTLLLLAHFVAAAGAPGLAKVLHRRSFLVLALVPGAAFVWLLAQTSLVTAGDVVTEEVAWVPSLGMDFTLQLGTLQWLLGLLVTGVGALALLYCAWYFKHDDPSLWRFTGVFTAFAGAMFGLVVADNLLALYIFWELTTVFSYTLIGHNPVRSANRRSATQALLVTTFGGLAMLVGTIILGETSSYTISEMLADPPPAGTLTTIAVLLVLVGALTKSAQLPFHFWLPGAMAAPTPVSAYLHAASMVKAGIYLILLLAPAFATVPGWRPVVIGLGIWTMILGGWRALRQDDIKLLLAYGTVSQLGMMTALAGVGSKAAAMATLALVMS